MINFKQMVESFGNDIEFSNNLINENNIASFENEIEAKFGDELKYYILNYGYLAMNDIEFFGINSKQMSKSDMIQTTKDLHINFNLTQNLIAFMKSTDDIYYLVDENDKVFRFDSVVCTLTPLEIDLITFIKNQLENC